MKEILEKFGLTEFFAYICPGAILLSSLILWVDLKRTKELLGEDIIKQELVIAVFILIFSYTLGLITSSLSSRGTNLYVRKKMGRQAFNRKGNILIWLLWVFCGLPKPHDNSSIVEAKLRIAEDLQRYTGLQGLSLIETPWDWLVIYRIIMTDRLGNQGKFILTEADSIHRRFLFSQGIGLAFFLVAAQSLVRFILHFIFLRGSFPCIITPPWLIVITLLGISTSVGLRFVAGRWWEEEFLLTSSLTQVPLEKDAMKRR